MISGLGSVLSAVWSSLFTLNFPGLGVSFGTILVGSFCVIVSIVVFRRLFNMFLPSQPARSERKNDKKRYEE